MDGNVEAGCPTDSGKHTGTMFIACHEVSNRHPVESKLKYQQENVDVQSKEEDGNEHGGCLCHSLEDAIANDSQNNEECLDSQQLTETLKEKLTVAASPCPPPRREMNLPVDINGITYVTYSDETVLGEITRLMSRDLSEPYSVYTYRYFIHGWPKLTFLAKDKEKYVGAIVCKTEDKVNGKRGYIAMLAVQDEYRRHGLGTQLVRIAVQSMMAAGCEEVVLETEVLNQPALRLYENLGFMRDKRLFRYYLNGVDALRLKLLLK
ncbi:N-alpha-acetyltransferase 30-like [Corticium candelabrum]|uniref:N-alpha-acetyltransferase 30-like n=1 Tax=Corticium candelabrum TaxID=121492 RepID=UPI002E271CB4|nr:N-alpha-acetyltransferase 30-like [Corticium candelabrum]